MYRSRLLMGIILFAFVMSFFMVKQGILNAGICQLVKIHGEPGSQVTLGLEPATMIIKKGSCVVWVNFVRTEEVQVIFKEDKVCKDVTASPAEYKLAAKNCDVTSYIKFKETSSLLFDEEGVFKYIVKSETETRSGKIIVRDS